MKVDRLNTLIEKFNVYKIKDVERITQELEGDDIDFKTIESENNDILALYYNSSRNQTIMVSDVVFNSMVDSDPTNNKMYTQWMLNLFNRLIKSNMITESIRLINEDLPLAKKYLNIFESNKRKQKFKDLCRNSYILKNVVNPVDINQYKSLSQLYDAVDPFIERDYSNMERIMDKFVTNGQALIPIRDRKYTVYIPLTLGASEIFDNFANWCTCKIGNGMFKNYTERKTPYHTNSKLYIIINNEFFNGTLNDDMLYQIHFESEQIKDRKNTYNNIDIYDKVLSKSEGLFNYFKEELLYLSKGIRHMDIKKNKYLNMLVRFGISDSLFDILNEKTPFIVFRNTHIPKMGEFTRFKNLETLEINSSGLVSWDSTLFDVKTLEVLVLRDNKIKDIPPEICKLKNLIFINLLGNEIKKIPEEIKYLDKTNGGNLYRIAISPDDIGTNNYNKLKELLPTVKFN